MSARVGAVANRASDCAVQVLIAARLYTSGYDMYAPAQNVLSHVYGGRDKNIYDDHAQNGSESTLVGRMGDGLSRADPIEWGSTPAEPRLAPGTFWALRWLTIWTST